MLGHKALYPSSGTEVTFLYHYYSDGGPVWLDGTRPIIPAIATLRRYTKAPILVVDISNGAEWGSFPHLLDFEVRRISPKYGTTILPDCNFLHKMASRCDDIIRAVPERPGWLLYTDYDVYWCGDPLPVPTVAPFQYHYWNSGIWLWDSRHPAARWYLDLQRDLMDRLLVDHELRTAVVSHVHDGLLSPEHILAYLRHTDGVTAPLDDRYNYFYWDITKPPPSDVRSVHLLSGLHGTHRAHLVILVREFERDLPLPSSALRDLFGPYLDRRGTIGLGDLIHRPWRSPYWETLYTPADVADVGLLR